MRWLLPTLALVLTLPSTGRAQPWATATEWAGPAPGEVRCAADEVLPAGVFHRTLGWHDAHLDGCPAPAVAVVQGAYGGGDEASRAARAAASPDLAPGYPWVVHTRAAGLEGDGIAVVLAQWARVEDAEAWMRAHAPGGRLLQVLGQEAALRRFHESHGGADPRQVPHVVHVERAVAALSARDAAAISDAHEGVSARDEDARLREVRRRTRARTRVARPRCRVPAGAVHVFEDEWALRARERVVSLSFQPVRCGRRVAWVPVEATRVRAVTWRHRDGRARVTQVVLVECDSPTLTTWIVEGGGRMDARVRHCSCG